MLSACCCCALVAPCLQCFSCSRHSAWTIGPFKHQLTPALQWKHHVFVNDFGSVIVRKFAPHCEMIMVGF